MTSAACEGRSSEASADGAPDAACGFDAAMPGSSGLMPLGSRWCRRDGDQPDKGRAGPPPVGYRRHAHKVHLPAQLSTHGREARQFEIAGAAPGGEEVHHRRTSSELRQSHGAGAVQGGQRPVRRIGRHTRSVRSPSAVRLLPRCEDSDQRDRDRHHRDQANCVPLRHRHMKSGRRPGAVDCNHCETDGAAQDLRRRAITPPGAASLSGMAPRRPG